MRSTFKIILLCLCSVSLCYGVVARQTSCVNRSDGSLCDDGNACTRNDTCQSGICVGCNEMACPVAGNCIAASFCDPIAGSCVIRQKGNNTCCDDGNSCTAPDMCVNGQCLGQKILSDGTMCNDNNMCTRTDTCHSGTCLGANPIVCVASDQCHDPGTCDSRTGLCSNPAKPNGTPCSDGNPCTQGDTCQQGTCTSGSQVSCPSSDQCKNSFCNSSTGSCTTSNKADGTSCNDNNQCTQTDTCQNGVCVGSNPLLCVSPGQCVSASCNPQSGCVFSNRTDGTPCNDGNACTQTDSCQQGVCKGSNVKQCPAPDQCHAPGVCDPSSGNCTFFTFPDGTPCDDNNKCTQQDICHSGTCAGTAVVCSASDQCHVAGTCNPQTGQCSNPNAPDNTTCNDNNRCTQGDRCTHGICVGSAIVCTALDQCHLIGTCDPQTGQCSNPTAPDNTTCNDENNCTTGDICKVGICAGNEVVCPAADQCHEAGTCNNSTGACSPPTNKPDTTACNDNNLCTQTDVCTNGTCAGTPIVCQGGCGGNSTCNSTTGACVFLDSQGLPCPA